MFIIIDITFNIFKKYSGLKDTTLGVLGAYTGIRMKRVTHSQELPICLFFNSFMFRISLEKYHRGS